MLNKILNHFLLKENICKSRDVLDVLRFSLLKKQLIHSYLNIPYYKKTFDEAGVHPEKLKTINDLASYPVITKDIVRFHHSELINQKGLFRGKFKSHTSGSTGQPMWTYYDFKSWIRKKYLVKARTRMECGVKPIDKIVIFESTSQNSSEKGNILFRTFKSHYSVYSIFDSIEKTVKKLITFSPSVLYGPPSYFFQMAQFIAMNNFQLPSIKRIFTSSEYLQDTVREYVKEIFNAEIYDIYGSTEFKEVAWECEKHEGYHINEDEVIVEVLSELTTSWKDGKPAKPGIIGNIVITDLRNTIMPLIRFQLNDKGILINEKCSCGRTFSMMKPYAGRSSEYIILPNDETLSPYLFTTSIERIEGLLQYQVIQITSQKILVNVITHSEDYRLIANTIKEILKNITKNMMEIEIQLKTKLELEENGKLKVVRNLLLN